VLYPIPPTTIAPAVTVVTPGTVSVANDADVAPDSAVSHGLDVLIPRKAAIPELDGSAEEIVHTYDAGSEPASVTTL
jgi:hypothetical protein